jgi:DNA modification methylase
MNSRTHSDDQVAQIAASIKEFGFTNPILIDDHETIIAGHGRLMAARKLKLTEVPTITLEGLTEAQKKAYVIADNKLALNAGWDTEALTAELRRLQELDFDLDLIGFDSDELAKLLEPEQVEGLTDEDDVPDMPERPVTVEGDIWVLGNHRLMCGDSTSIDAVDKLMDGENVDCVYTDPPYGIDIVKGGHVGGGKLASVGTYAPVANDNSIEVAVQAIQVIQTLRAKVEIIWGGNYYATSLPNSSCWIVWDKENTGNFADCELAWTNQETSVRKFTHMWNGMLKASERGQKRCHPTQKPVALAEWCFDQYAQNCTTVCDLFGGSGSTLIGCETKNKRGFIMELSPLYCDVIIKRWQDYTGNKAVHADTGEAFDE